MTNYVINNIDLVDFDRGPDAVGGLSWERIDLIDALNQSSES